MTEHVAYLRKLAADRRSTAIEAIESDQMGRSLPGPGGWSFALGGRATREERMLREAADFLERFATRELAPNNPHAVEAPVTE